MYIITQWLGCISIIFVYCLGCLASVAAPQNLSWHKTGSSVALLRGKTTVWQFNYAPGCGKPYFHPVASLDGAVLTEYRPADHPWHYGLWFSWKYINGVNFWEENRKTHKSQGQLHWGNVKVVTHPDYSAEITMILNYSLKKGAKPVLKEKRSINVSAPDSKGAYSMDWSSTFTACSDSDVKFDRTEVTKTRAWGGYAGLSIRLNHKGDKWQTITEKGPVTKWKSNRFRCKGRFMDYSGSFQGHIAGVAILDNPANLNFPTPWYAIRGKKPPMIFFTPAVICYKPYTLKAGESFTLRYRVIIHSGRWDAKKLLSEWEKYKQIETSVKIIPNGYDNSWQGQS